MKTAIAIDSLLFRDDSIFLLELILNLLPNSEIYTIAHKQGSILGQIETRPIVSSFLSHKVKKHELSVFAKNYWIMPSAVKGIPLHPTIEKVVILSRGYIHGLNLPPNVEKFLYIMDWSLIEEDKLGIMQKLFTNYVNDWREKTLRYFPKIAVSSETLKEKLELPNAEVIVPTYRTQEFPFVRDEDHNFSFTHHLVFTQGLTLNEFRTIAKTLSEKDEIVRVLGPDAHLESVKKEFPKVEFGGDHCEATNALYSHQAKAVWDLSQNFFPSKAFGAFATGRPAVVRDLKLNREFLTQGTLFLPFISEETVLRMRDEIENSHAITDRKSLRRFGLKWNERLFKSKMVRFLGVRNT